jgi:hypothetical protein
VTRKVGVSVIAPWIIATTAKVELLVPADDDDPIEYNKSLDSVSVRDTAFASTHKEV